MRWLPNLLTMARFPLAAWVAASILRGAHAEALLLLAAAGISDSLDGWLARRLKASSRAGAVLDPLADKALLITVYVALGAAGLVPAWLVWLVVGRDLLMLLFAAAVMGLGMARRFEPSVWGKLSTVVQVVTGVAVLAARALPSPWLGWWAEALPVVAAVTTGWSGIHYAWLGARMLRRQAPGSALPRQDPAGGRDHVPRQ